MTRENFLLIHGTWGSGGALADLVAALEHRGFAVHSPSLRHHGTPKEIDIWGEAQKVATVGLLDYVDDLVELVKSMDSPPIVAGHSVGALLAQLVAARVPTKGVVLFGTAPAAGQFCFYPGSLQAFGRFVPNMLLGRPIYPHSFAVWRKTVCNTLPVELAAEWYATLCAESGTAYREMTLWYLDPKRAARVDWGASTAPVLVVAGSEDRITPPRLSRNTAAKYGSRAEYAEIQGSDHMMTAGPFLPATLAEVDGWLERNRLRPSASAAS